MVKKYGIKDGAIVKSRDPNSPILVFINPDEREQRMLRKKHGVNEHFIRSAMDPNELSWMECDQGYVAIIFKRPKNYSVEDQLLFKLSTIGVFLSGGRLIILVSQETDFFSDKLFLQVSSLHEVVLKMIYHSIHHFMGHLKIINMLSTEIEQKINKAMENKYLINLFTLEKTLVYYLDSINSNGWLIERIKHNADKVGFGKNAEMIDDMEIENTQCAKQAEIYSNVLASLMDARASIVSNNLNILIKVQNVITIAIMVPTFVVSIFSMNVGLPMQSHPHAFWVILGISTASMLMFIMIWRMLKL